MNLQRNARTSTPAPPSPTGVRWVLNVPYPQRSEATRLGARWDPDLRAFIYTGDTLPEGLGPYQAPALSWERWRQDDLNGTISPAGPVDPDLVPRPHQIEAVNHIHAAYIEDRPGFLLGDDVGTGKTISAWVAVRDLPDPQNILVVCPKSVIPHWRRSIEALGTAGKRVCVVNYDRLKALLHVPDTAKQAKRTRTKNKRIATKGTSIVPWDIVIVDESHKAKNPQAQRSQALRTLTADAFTIWMSATAGTTPLDLAYLSPLLAHMTGTTVKDLSDFEQWCQQQGIKVKQGQWGRWEWDPNETDLEAMRALLYDPADGAVPAGIRRRPADIAGWPEVLRVLVPVELGIEEARLYQQAWTEFRANLDLAPKGKDASGLGALTRFRQKASLLRVESTVDQVVDLLDNGLQVAVSAAWLESLEQIANTLDSKGVPVAAIHGQMTTDERESERVAFQTGECRVCVFTPVEGISLHAGESMVDGNEVPRALVLHDLRWSAFEQLQVEGRTHRDGQFAPVYLTFAAGTVEERIAEVMLGRVASTMTLNGDDTDTLRQIEAELVSWAG